MAAIFGSRRSSCSTASRSRRRASSPSGAVKIERMIAPSASCWSRRTWPRRSRRKCTVQRCHGVPSTCASAAFSPGCASLIASSTPTRIAALKRPLTERLHLLIEQAGDPADLALGDPQPEALDELIDTPRRDAADIRLLDHAHERLLAALARLQETREV